MSVKCYTFCFQIQTSPRTVDHPSEGGPLYGSTSGDDRGGGAHAVLPVAETSRSFSLFGFTFPGLFTVTSHSFSLYGFTFPVFCSQYLWFVGFNI